MKLFFTLTLIFITSLLGSLAAAQDLDPSQEKNTSRQQYLDKQFGTSIKVRQAGDSVVKEYQSQGKTYKVEVVPKTTPTYILTDQDGDGNLNSSNTNLDTDVVVPEWSIGSW